VRVPLRPEDGFVLRPADLESALTERSRLLLINSPSNPTGTVFDEEVLGEIAEFAEAAGLYVMHDEVFDEIIFEGRHLPLLKLAGPRKRVVMVNSISKRFGMTGWRLGWLVASGDVVSQATKAHTFMSLATGTLIQEAVAPAMNDPSVQQEVSAHVDVLRDRSHKFARALSAVSGFDCAAPAGGFYLFPKVRKFYDDFVPTQLKHGSVSEAVAGFFLSECKVAVVPGSAFGPGGDECLRISMVGPETSFFEAVRRFSGSVTGHEGGGALRSGS
jgi:aspartate/methionine/tyrosine aminotransferase